jgi:Domain of unknown function (DUF4185)
LLIFVGARGGVHPVGAAADYRAMRSIARAAVVVVVGLSACAEANPPDLRVVSIDEQGEMQSPSTIVGRDGGDSGRFAGRSVWVYGDTVTTSAGSFPSTWRNNTMSFTEDADASDGITGFVQPQDELGAPREFFPRTAQEQAFDEEHFDRGDGSCAEPCGARQAIWGGGPVPDPARARALLSYGKVYAEPGEFNFHLVGTSFAIWDDFDAGPQRPEVVSGLGDPTLLFDAPTEGEFGTGTNLVDDRLYAFSCAGGGGHDGDCRLARVHIDDIFDRDAWEFRSDDGWSAQVDDAMVLFAGSPNMSVAYVASIERWLALYMDWDAIEVRTAEQIEGPWSDPETVFVSHRDGSPHAHLHPEFAEQDGAVQYVSYLADHFRLLRLELAPR